MFLTKSHLRCLYFRMKSYKFKWNISPSSSLISNPFHVMGKLIYSSQYPLFPANRIVNQHQKLVFSKDINLNSSFPANSESSFQFEEIFCKIQRNTIVAIPVFLPAMVRPAVCHQPCLNLFLDNL